MKHLHLALIASLLLLAGRFSACGHTFTVTIWDYWGIPEGETNIQVTDGTEWFQAPLIAIEGDPTGEYDENNNEILTNLRNSTRPRCQSSGRPKIAACPFTSPAMG